MNSNYVAMIVVLVVWLGIFIYIFKLDKKVNKLEDE